MTHVTYKIVEHDGGWAYTVNGVFSEPFPNRAAALAAARRVAAEQRVPGRTEMIEYETPDGRWHSETAAGNDRPETEVEGTGSIESKLWIYVLTRFHANRPPLRSKTLLFAVR